ncbi:hypothetical protein B0H65DRAFT_471580 [Neurospora tetraspora]|uniref:Uncharacterized protein n=1 Tax=Neurospora tetraspora TaxID=94610 RepID=A0AAE0JA25_9PEZI|nr:hypothetical protein B0H65DRAFT_471580 [Neurospora tetraspora]
MVYRAILTITCTINTSSKEHLHDQQPNQASEQLDQITSLKNLALSCRQVRDELVHEYVAYVLPFTQIHLGSAYRTPTPSPLALTNHRIFQELQSSSFLTQNIQHISLHWGGCTCSEDGSRFQKQIEPRACLFWLTALPQLKTLEIVFTDPFYLPIQRFTSASMTGLPGPGPGVAEEAVEEADAEWSDSDDGGAHELVEFFCSFCWCEGLMALPPTLEKVIFRVWCREDPDDEVHPAAVDETWEVTKWYRRTRVAEEQYERTGIWKRVKEDHEDGDESEVCSCPALPTLPPL